MIILPTNNQIITPQIRCQHCIRLTNRYRTKPYSVVIDMTVRGQETKLKVPIRNRVWNRYKYSTKIEPYLATNIIPKRQRIMCRSCTKNSPRNAIVTSSYNNLSKGWKITMTLVFSTHKSYIISITLIAFTHIKGECNLLIECKGRNTLSVISFIRIIRESKP